MHDGEPFIGSDANRRAKAFGTPAAVEPVIGHLKDEHRITGTVSPTTTTT
jgi:hypothetical protein